jgi:hypothetical protein
MKKIIAPDRTIEEVWQWRRKAYGELDGLSEKERIRRIRQVGKKYTNKLHLRHIEREIVK